jgi:RNA polymerase sigma-70 factor, ECF subfamily
MSVLRPLYAEDLALVARIVNGEEAAAEEFARIYFERFVYLARRKGVPRQECQDVAQEALLAALSQMQRGLFRGESRLSTWLEHVLHGKALDYWRTQRSGAVVPLEELAGEDLDSLVQALAAPTTASDLVLAVRQALQTLPPQPRAILLLNRTYGYTLEEISRMLEMTRGQVGWRLTVAEDLFRRGLNVVTPPSAASLPASSGTGAPRVPRRLVSHTTRRLLETVQRASRLSGSVHWSVVDRLLLWSRDARGAAFGRSALARMHKLLVRGAAFGSGRARAGDGAQFGADLYAV